MMCVTSLPLTKASPTAKPNVNGKKEVLLLGAETCRKKPSKEGKQIFFNKTIHHKQQFSVPLTSTPNSEQTATW